MATPFVLVKSPAGFNLPSTQPSCLEAELYLYLARERKSENSDAESPRNQASPVGGNQQSTSEGSPKARPSPEFKVVSNPYWGNAMQVQHDSLSYLPIMHHDSDVVPSENVISYLQDRYYDIDQDLPPQTQTDIRLSHALAKKLMVAVNYLLISDKSYTIASGVNLVIRTQMTRFYRDYIEARANANDIYTEKEAYYEVAHALTLFASRLSNNLYFASEPTTLDVSVAASVALCVFGPSEWLQELVYQSFPSLATHCHRLLSVAEIPEYTAQIDTNRTIPNLIQSSLRALNAKPSKAKPVTPGTPQTPRMGQSKSGADSDDSNDDDDDDLNDNDDDYASTAQTVPITQADVAQTRFALQESSVLLRSYAVNAVTLLYSTMEKREFKRNLLSTAQKFGALVVGVIGAYFFLTLARSHTQADQDLDITTDADHDFHRLHPKQEDPQ